MSIGLLAELLKKSQADKLPLAASVSVPNEV